MPFTVFTSESQFFQYWDETKNLAGYEFSPPTHKISMSFREFVDSMRYQTAPSAEDGEGARPLGQGKRGGGGGRRYYLQQMLVTGIGTDSLEGFNSDV
jgi:hypothetical protein